MAIRWQVTGESVEGKYDGRRFVLMTGYKQKKDADAFALDYEKKPNRNFINLRAEKEGENNVNED